MRHYSLSEWAGAELIWVTEHHISFCIENSAISLQTDTEIEPFFSQTLSETDSSEQKIYKYSQVHTHDDFIEIFYVYSGAGVAYLNNTKRSIAKGFIGCVNVGDIHYNYPFPELHVFNVLLSTSLLRKGGPLFQTVLGGPGHLNFSAIHNLNGELLMKVDALFKDMFQEAERKAAGYQNMLISYVNQLLILLYRSEQFERIHSRLKYTIAPLLEYISMNFASITLQQLATYSSYNPSYLSRLFHESLGISFTDYVNKLRIDAATKMLLHTNNSIDEICSRVGFKSKFHFYEVFKKHTGLTPGLLRKTNKSD